MFKQRFILLFLSIIFFQSSLFSTIKELPQKSMLERCMGEEAFFGEGQLFDQLQALWLQELKSQSDASSEVQSLELSDLNVLLFNEEAQWIQHLKNNYRDRYYDLRNMAFHFYKLITEKVCINQETLIIGMRLFDGVGNLQVTVTEKNRSEVFYRIIELFSKTKFFKDLILKQMTVPV